MELLMTTPIPPIEPVEAGIIPPYVPPYGPTPNITPFTYRDGQTYLQILEGLRVYINRTVVPFVNSNLDEFGQIFVDEVNRLIDAVNAAIDLVINDSIELQDPVMAGIIADIDSATRILLDSLYKAPEIKFDLATAKLRYGMALESGTPTKSVMQSIGVEPVTKQTFYSQYVTGTQAGRETIIVTLCTPAGYVVGTMTFVDAGHGAGVFFEYDTATSALYVWTQFTDVANPDVGTKYHVIRTLWAAGASYVYADVASSKLLAAEGAYKSPHYDVTTGQVGFRTNIGTTGATFTTHNMADIKAGVWAPLTTVQHTWPVSTVQGYVPINGKWYCLTGTASSALPYVPATVYSINENGGVEYTRNVESARNNVTDFVATDNEPEGIFTLVDDNGIPALGFGISFGSTGHRAQKIHTLAIGSLTLSKTSPTDDSGWSSAPVTWLPGFSRDTGGFPFSVRKQGNKLILAGRIAGSFGPGLVDIGTLSAAYTVPTTRQIVAVKQYLAASPSAVCGIELSSTGTIRTKISVAADHTGPVTWVEIPYTVVELNGYPTQAD